MLSPNPFRRARAAWSRHGFTLLELIVVIVVLGLLAAIAIPTFVRTISNSEDTTEVASHESLMREAQAVYRLEQGSGVDDWTAALATAIGDMSFSIDGVSAAPAAPTLLFEDFDEPGPPMEAQRPAAGDSETPWTWKVGASATHFGFAGRTANPDRSIFCRVTVSAAGNPECWISDQSPIAINAVGGQSSTETGVVANGPSAPQNLDVLAGNGSITVTWEVPDDQGSSPITSYEVFVDGDLYETTAHDVFELVVTGLDNGTDYVISVRATNTEGPGSSATAAPTTPFGDPDAVAGFVAAPANQSVVLSWTPKASTGANPISSYVISRVDGETRTVVTTISDLEVDTFTVEGLTNGTAYTFVIVAMNGSVPGPDSALAAATPATVPATMPAPTVTLGDAQLAVSWSAPAANGSAITGYVVEYRAVGAPVFTPLNVTATNRTITGLINGTSYQVRVTATNGMGSGVEGAIATATPRTVPAAPTIGVPAAGHRAFSVTWSANGNGGAAIDNYRIEYRKQGTTTWYSTTIFAGSVNISTADVGGVLYGHGHTWQVQVLAHNAAGWSAPSAIQTVKPWSSVMYYGEVMESGDSLTSANGAYALIMQGDGNLVRSPDLWNTGTSGRYGARFGWAGGFPTVIHAGCANQLCWSTNYSTEYTGAFFEIRNNGRLSQSTGAAEVWAVG